MPTGRSVGVSGLKPIQTNGQSTDGGLSGSFAKNGRKTERD
jgi:hypothetical protein